MRSRATFNAKDARLADTFRTDIRTGSVVVVEEGVEADAVAVDGGAAEDAESPAFGVVGGGWGCVVGG